MTTLTPSYDTGATTKASDMVYVPPARQVDDDALRQQQQDLGLDMAFVADVLSAALTHERCGRHLYRSLEGRTNNPVLQRTYRQFGQETERHARILEQLITAMGGDPMYVSPAARGIEATDTKLLESTFLLSGSLDAMTQEMVMLDAVLIAESVDHSNWTALTELATALPEGPVREAFLEAVTQVGTEVDEHLTWARQTKTRMIQLRASSSVMAAAGAKVEELTETVRGWFSA